MSLPASRCYYHPDRGAVATCAKCGAGVCDSCAVKYDGRIFCQQCGNEELKQDHKEYRKWLKENGGRFRDGKDFIGPGMIGILIVVIFGVLNYFYMNDELNWGIAYLGWGEFLCGAYLLFSIPFCYTLLNDFFTPRYGSVGGFIGMFKLIFSLFTGWIVFPFIVIRFVIRKMKSKKNKT